MANTEKANKKFLQKKESIRELGMIAKNFGLVKNFEDTDIGPYSFIKPSERNKGYVAKSNDYVVIMHFNENLKGILINDVNEYVVDQAFQDFQYNNFKRENLVKNYNFNTGDLENVKNNQTYTAKKDGGINKLDMSALGAYKESAEMKMLPTHL